MQPPGLINRVSNCYFNSAVQALLAIPHITKPLLSTLAPVDGVVSEMQNLVRVVFDDQRNSGICDPLPLLYQLAKVVKFKIGPQHDAGEFFLYLLKHLEEKFPRQMSAIVAGKHQIVRTCGRCGDVETTTAGFNNLVIEPIKDGGISIGAAIRQSIKDETIAEFKCEKCPQSTKGPKNSAPAQATASRLWAIGQLPSVLVLTIGGEFGQPRLAKMPRSSLLFGEFNCKYKLSSIILHHGNAQSGHYNALVCWGDTWYLTDDTRVSQVNLADMERMILANTCQLVYCEINMT